MTLTVKLDDRTDAKLREMADRTRGMSIANVARAALDVGLAELERDASKLLKPASVTGPER